VLGLLMPLFGLVSLVGLGRRQHSSREWREKRGALHRVRLSTDLDAGVGFLVMQKRFFRLHYQSRKLHHQ
jgi:hypothetical protein